MKNMKKLMPFFCLLLGGCDIFSIISSPIQERGVTGFFKDNALRLKINNLFLSRFSGMPLYTMVHEGRVVLLGRAPSKATKNKIVKAVRAITGVKEVFDEILLGEESWSDYSRDVICAQDFHSRLFFDVRILDQNYHSQVFNRVIYLLGVAQNKEELGYVREHAERIKGIRRIISHVTILPPQRPS